MGIQAPCRFMGSVYMARRTGMVDRTVVFIHDTNVGHAWITIKSICHGRQCGLRTRLHVNADLVPGLATQGAHARGSRGRCRIDLHRDGHDLAATVMERADDAVDLSRRGSRHRHDRVKTSTRCILHQLIGPHRNVIGDIRLPAGREPVMHAAQRHGVDNDRTTSGLLNGSSGTLRGSSKVGAFDAGDDRAGWRHARGIGRGVKVTQHPGSYMLDVRLLKPAEFSVASLLHRGSQTRRKSH